MKSSTLRKVRLHMLKGQYEPLGELSGNEMVGWTYNGPYDELQAAQEIGGHTQLPELNKGVSLNANQAHRVIPWDEVGETEGTGIVHIAPGCGAEDFQIGKEFGLPLIAPLTEEGIFVDGFGWLSGLHVSEVAEPIFDRLKAEEYSLPGSRLHAPLPDLLALPNRTGFPSCRRVVHQHGRSV